MRARVVRRVGRPQHAHAMTRAVEGVVAGVVGEQQRHPRRRAGRELEDAMLVDEVQQRQRDHAHARPRDQAAHTDAEVVARVVAVIQREPVMGRDRPLEQHARHHQRDEQGERVHGASGGRARAANRGNADGPRSDQGSAAAPCVRVQSRRLDEARRAASDRCDAL